MSNLNYPLTPGECDVSNFPFMPLDIDRLLNSETWILGDDSEKVASMTLWLKSWKQIPAASIPNNDKMLAHLSGMGAKWKKVREHALRGWIDGGDGRLYHPVVAEKALEAWIEKLASAISGAQGNAKRWQIEINTSDLQNQLCDAVYRLKNIAPQSKALTKKISKIIESQSQPVSGGDGNPNPVGIATDKTGNRIDNINTHTQDEPEKNSLDEILDLWNPTLHELNSWFVQAGLPQYTQEQLDQIKPEFLSYYADQLKSGLLKPDKLFGKLVAWIKRDYKPRDKQKPNNKSSGYDSRNVNDTWNQPQEPVKYNEAKLPELTEQDLEEWQ